MKKEVCIALTMIKRHICVLIITLIANFGNVFAHEDLYYDKFFGNVKTSILTGFMYEEINKVTIFGQLAEKLCKELNYSEPVYLFFQHDYTGKNIPGFFISYEEIELKHLGNGVFLKDNGIVIRQFSRRFCAQTTLKLLEHAILNLQNVKSTQGRVAYKNHYNFKITSIDTLAVGKILTTSNSELLNNVLNTRIDRPEENLIEGISYYWQNDRYFVFSKHMWWDNEKQSLCFPEYVLFDVENIYDFHRFNSWSAVIFDTDSSFYSAKQSTLILYGDGSSRLEHKPQISQRYIIENMFEYYQPFKVENIGGDKFSIYFWHYSNKPSSFGKIIGRTLIYLVDEDLLIQDLDSILGELINKQ